MSQRNWRTNLFENKGLILEDEFRAQGEKGNQARDNSAVLQLPSDYTTQSCRP